MPSLFSSTEVTGHCLCKDVKIKIDRECLTDKSNHVFLCHCDNCQRAGGGLSSLCFMLPNEKAELIDEKNLIKKYNDTGTTSKEILERYFCSKCGSPIYSKSSKFPSNLIVIKLSLFVNKVEQLPPPTVELFCKQMMKWEKRIDGTTYYDKSIE